MRFPWLSLVVLVGLSSAEEFRVQTLAYKQDSTALEGLFVLPAGAKGALPGIVLFPDWMGVTPQALDYAKHIAGWGYAVFVADVYGKNIRPKTMPEASKASGALKADIPLLRLRDGAALSMLKRQAGVDTAKIGDVGFCFGGGAALEMARSGAELKGVISVHGNLNTPFPDDAKQIHGHVMVLHGADDPFEPPEQIQNFMTEMRKGGVDWQFVYYGGAVHGFTNPHSGTDAKTGLAYNPKAEKRAFEAMKTFLAEAFAP